MAKCYTCNGKGTVDCPECKGSGKKSFVMHESYECKYCNGSGQKTCPSCNGKDFRDY